MAAPARGPRLQPERARASTAWETRAVRSPSVMQNIRSHGREWSRKRARLARALKRRRRVDARLVIPRAVGVFNDSTALRALAAALVFPARPNRNRCSGARMYTDEVARRARWLLEQQPELFSRQLLSSGAPSHIPERGSCASTARGELPTHACLAPGALNLCPPRCVIGRGTATSTDGPSARPRPLAREVLHYRTCRRRPARWRAPSCARAGSTSG